MLLMIRCDDRCSVHNSLRRSVRGLLQARGTRGEDILTTQFNLSPDRPQSERSTEHSKTLICTADRGEASSRDAPPNLAFPLLFEFEPHYFPLTLTYPPRCSARAGSCAAGGRALPPLPPARLRVVVRR